MKITYDKDADAMYIYFSKKKIKKTVGVSDRVLVDLDSSGNIRGIEMLFVTKTILPEAIKDISLQLPNIGNLVLKLPIFTFDKPIKIKEKLSK